MDEIVLQAMRKWPEVPNCFGWLGLDTRGDWYLRDDQAQAVGAFSSGLAGSKGSELRHEKLMAFIGRNYTQDSSGCWYFQNGPQRVYVELQAAPWVWRLQPDGKVHTHTGQPVQISGAWTDELDRLYLDSERGIGLVHSQDMLQASELLEQHQWPLQTIGQAEMPTRFGFVKSPKALLNP
jgi:hypothetical protein